MVEGKGGADSGGRAVKGGGGEAERVDSASEALEEDVVFVGESALVGSGGEPTLLDVETEIDYAG